MPFGAERSLISSIGVVFLLYEWQITIQALQIENSKLGHLNVCVWCLSKINYVIFNLKGN